MILLDIGMPIADWLALGMSVLIMVVAYLLSRMLKGYDERISKLEQQVEQLNTGREADREKYFTDRMVLKDEINNMEREILDKLSEIKNTFNNLRTK